MPFPALPGRRRAVRRDRMQARPVAAARPEFSVHPLTPLSERDRRRRPGRRIVTLAVAALALAVAVPVMGAALAPAAPPLSPLAGGVAGAASQPSATPASGRSPGSRRPGPRRAAFRCSPSPIPTDAEGPAHRAFGPPEAPPASSLTGYQWPISRRPGHAAVQGDPRRRVQPERQALPRRGRHGLVLRRAGRRPPTTASSSPPAATSTTSIGWVGDLGPYYTAARRATSGTSCRSWSSIDDGNGYRSMYAHFRDVTVQAGPARPGGPADRPRGRDRPRLGLPRPLRAVQPARDEAVRRPGGHHPPDEGARSTRSPGSTRCSSCPAATSPSGPRSIAKAIKAAAPSR